MNWTNIHESIRISISISIGIRKRKLFLCLTLILMSRNRKCEQDNMSIMKRQYLISAEIQLKIAPNPALISSFKIVSSSNTLDFYEKLAEVVRTYPCMYDKSVDNFREANKRHLAFPAQDSPYPFLFLNISHPTGPPSFVRLSFLIPLSTSTKQY